MGRSAHLFLVGLPGAGKTTVGRLLAERLRWPFVDLDERIAHQAARSVGEIFARQGEARFRDLEREATLDVVASPEAMVVAPGGGWITVPGMIEAVRPPSRLIWLRLSPAAALQRLGAAVASRPLLAGTNPRAAMEAISAQREEFYLQSDHAVSVETMTPAEVVEAIVVLARPCRGD